MNHVERFRALMNFEPVDRLPIIEWAMYWNQTVDRWHREGLPADVKEVFDIGAFFGLDPYRQYWIHPIHWTAPKPSHHGAGLIAGKADYDALQPYLFNDDLLPVQEIEKSRQAHARGELVVWLTLVGFFAFPRSLFGIEPHFYAFYDHPKLMHRMNEELLAYNIRVIERFCEVLRPEFMTFVEDMSYNHGSMLSKASFDEFLAPYYRRITPVLKEHGITCIVDSDGDITEAVPWFESVGVDGILPLERQAGVDLPSIRKAHPRFCCVGHFDKMTMWRGEAAMRAEFERLLPSMRQGGFIPSVDHQTPPGVSMDNYRIYLRLLREYCHRAGEEMAR